MYDAGRGSLSDRVARPAPAPSVRVGAGPSGQLVGLEHLPTVGSLWVCCSGPSHGPTRAERTERRP